MTCKEFKQLKRGTIVQWREGSVSPRAGEVTEIGIVHVSGERRFIRWKDGQETEGFDDSALRSVEVKGCVPPTPKPGRPAGVRMPCGWGCGALLMRSEIGPHWDACPKRPIVNNIGGPQTYAGPGGRRFTIPED
jgi:hypothetical protein